jgi:DNA-binding beta-propeller fold protein YncE
VFASGYVTTHFETVAYNGATGARLWAKAYHLWAKGFGPGDYSVPRAIAVSPGGRRVYVTGGVPGTAMATVAYDARTGRQLWARGFLPKDGADALAIAASPDGTTVYVAGYSRGAGQSKFEFTLIAYAAATGRLRWLRYYAKVKPSAAVSVAVSPDGRTVYATGAAGSDALTVAYRASGTVKWATRYKNPFGAASGDQVVAAPGGGVVYVVGRELDEAGHVDTVTVAYRAATGQRKWLDSLEAGKPEVAVTPDGQTVIVTGPEAGGNRIAAYNASTGATRWARLAHAYLAGLVIDPHGDTFFVGGQIAAYSVADGTVLWISSSSAGLGVIGLSGDGTRLFGTGWSSPGDGVITAAYQT